MAKFIEGDEATGLQPAAAGMSVRFDKGFVAFVVPLFPPFVEFPPLVPLVPLVPLALT